MIDAGIVCKEKEALTICIKSSRSIYIFWKWTKITKSFVIIFPGKLRQDAVGFIKENV